MITKNKVWEKPTYGDLGLSLIATKEHIINMNFNKENNVDRIALPLIGCGIDGLEWKMVRKAIKEVFGDLDIKIVVCYLERDKDKVEEV